MRDDFERLRRARLHVEWGGEHVVVAGVRETCRGFPLVLYKVTQYKTKYDVIYLTIAIA